MYYALRISILVSMSESAPGRRVGGRPGAAIGWNRDAGLSVFGMRTAVGLSGIPHPFLIRGCREGSDLHPGRLHCVVLLESHME